MMFDWKELHIYQCIVYLAYIRWLGQFTKKIFDIFQTKVAWQSHMDIHAGVKNFQCAECGLAFRSKQELKGHVTRNHLSRSSFVKKSLPCELCGKLFRHMHHLKSHFQLHQVQTRRRHRCQECNLTFKSEDSLHNHQVLHDPNRPFPCSKCSLRFKNKDAWLAHETLHGRPQFSCPHCADVHYTRKDNLKRHLRDKHPTL